MTHSRIVLSAGTQRADDGPLADRLRGRLLAYANAETLELAAAQTRLHEASGLIVQGRRRSSDLRDYRSLKLWDPALWKSSVATVEKPLDLGDGLFGSCLNDWVESEVGAYDGVFAPSLFVRSGDWAALKAVLAAQTDSLALPLVATDAAMLDEPRLIDEVVASGLRNPAFVFAAARRPLQNRGRVAGLRRLLDAVPGALVLATEPIVATDAMVHGAGAAAIGVTSGLRQPRRPGDKGGGPLATGWVPGLFLRELWEHRSPPTYAQWYAGSSADPCCDACGGRKLTTFSGTPEHKAAVLKHNIHEWLFLHDELRSRPEVRVYLQTDRWRAYQTHVLLRPNAATRKIDAVLQQLVDLDGPGQTVAPVSHRS